MNETIGVRGRARRKEVAWLLDPPHLLDRSGRPVIDLSCEEGDCYLGALPRYRGVGGPGHPLCTCGERGPHTRTVKERRAWHAAHKAGEPWPAPVEQGEEEDGCVVASCGG